MTQRYYLLPSGDLWDTARCVVVPKLPVVFEDANNEAIRAWYKRQPLLNRPASAPEALHAKEPEEEAEWEPVDLAQYKIKVLGKVLGVGLRDRHSYAGDTHQTVCLLTEDDGNWFEKSTFSNYWLPELLDVLQQTQQILQGSAYEPDITGGETYGYKRKI